MVCLKNWRLYEKGEPAVSIVYNICTIDPWVHLVRELYIDFSLVMMFTCSTHTACMQCSHFSNEMKPEE